MTLTIDSRPEPPLPPTALPPPAAALPPPPPPEPQRRPASAGWVVAGTALTILGALLLGFAAHLALVSHLMHEREQQIGYDELRATMARATTPVGQKDFRGELVVPGTPIALLEIPAIGVSEVVREGTSSGVLQMGPGHRRDTVMPGQPGASVLMGRNFAYGGPFGGIDQLVRGNGILVTTGQGQNRYEVVKVRRAGSLQLPPLEANEGRLTLVTADGPWFMPSGVVRVDAELVSEPQPRPARAIPANALPEAEQVMKSDQTALIPLVFWAQALFLAAAGMVFALAKWGRWQAWTVGVPLLAVLGITIAHTTTRLLPNLF